MPNLTRIGAAAAAAALALLTIAPAVGATTRPYLDLPTEQLPDVTQFVISDTGHVTVDFTIPASVPVGGTWYFAQAGFGAGGFDSQKPVYELLAPGQHFSLDVDTDTPCVQVDTVLTGPLNPTGQPYSADLTHADICQPGYKPPTEQTPPPALPPAPGQETEQAPPPTTEAVAPPTIGAPSTPAPEAEVPGPAAETPTAAAETAEIGQPAVVPGPARASSLPTTGSSNAGPMTATALGLMVLGSGACVPNWLKRRALR